MNNVAIAPYIGMHALQLQNVKRNVVKKVSVDIINEEMSAQQDETHSNTHNTNNTPVDNESTNIEHLPVQTE